MSADKQSSQGMVRIRRILKRFVEQVDSLNALVWREVCLSLILSELFFSPLIKTSNFLTNRIIA